MLPSLLSGLKNTMKIFLRTNGSIVINVDVDKEQNVDIENNISSEPVVWMKNFMAFFLSWDEADNMAELILVFGVTKVKCLLQNDI